MDACETRSVRHEGSHLTVEQAGAELPGRPIGVLFFTCNARGRRMFGFADHERVDDH